MANLEVRWQIWKHYGFPEGQIRKKQCWHHHRLTLPMAEFQTPWAFHLKPSLLTQKTGMDLEDLVERL